MDMGRLADRIMLAATALVTLGGAALMVRRGIRSMLHASRRLVHLIDDIAGEPAHGDQPARPGLMARLANIESRLTVLEELRPNGGSSIKDKVDQLAAAATERV